MNCFQLEPQAFFTMGHNHLRLIAASSSKTAAVGNLSAPVNACGLF